MGQASEGREPEATVDTAVEIVDPEDEALELLPEREEHAGGTLALFETDPKIEERGIWFEDFRSGVKLLVAHDENEYYADYLQQLIRPQIGLVQSNSPEGYRFMRRAEAKARARYVLLGWEGFTDENGAEVEYSEEQAFTYLHAKKYRKIRRLVASFSGDDNAFGRERKNLGKD